MTVLITGGAGFVGLNIARQLLELGQHVVSYGLEAPPSWAMRHLEKLDGQITVKTGDVRDRDQLCETMQNYGVRRVVHGAAVTAGLSREASNAQLIAAVNLGGTIEVLEAALKSGIERVVQLGSGSVYGTSVKQQGWLDETDDVPLPDSLYGITKYAAERTALRYRQTRELDVVVARLGVVFGRWEYDTGVRDTLSIPLALTQLAEAGGHARFRAELPNDWVYVTDVANAVVRLLQSPSVPQPLYHVSSGQRWSAVSWCERLREHYPSFSFEVVDDLNKANVGQQAPVPRPPFSIARIQADMDYRVQFHEPEAFSDYIAWRKEQLSPR